MAPMPNATTGSVGVQPATTVVSAVVAGAIPMVMAAAVTGGAKEKKMRCSKCKVDSHDTKSCTVAHYCYICNKDAHQIVSCPILRLPKPYAGLAGIGADETMFSHLPDSVFKPQLAPSMSPTALVTVSGDTVSAEVIQALVARVCPLQSVWN